ncbi:enoyl-CoA hydratase-related protein [Pelotalea chapellei]|uniref:Enoyl-CoA hydratase/isomerase family protein n=1 Tax=Pelotalea chapellei TaxID=44671 RepID=A0ABS5UBB5_9BACT|nr:enoyl-CoA hydratase-related protein [Pelotalea chapellei]MBT1072993.1 enoyl-CoA hydratase/isomerase family protein [Pelotalea chapellei]
MEYKNLLIETTDAVATLTVNRPQALNALNSEVLDELGRALYQLEYDSAVKVVVLTGAGEKAFVAGADIKEMADMSSYEGHRFAVKGQHVMMAMEKMKKPVIAAVNGFALGGGLELALGCDFIYASQKAKLGFPEVTLGIIPGFGGTQNLSRLIGPNKANEMIFTGRMIGAEKACSWGIVNEVFAPEELLDKARETAAAIAGVGSLGVAYAKDAIANGLNMVKEDGFRYEASLFGVLFATEDQKEGMAAFVEKRKAAFKNR